RRRGFARLDGRMRPSLHERCGVRHSTSTYANSRERKWLLSVTHVDFFEREVPEWNDHNLRLCWRHAIGPVAKTSSENGKVPLCGAVGSAGATTVIGHSGPLRGRHIRTVAP